jgi:hypothetical protein
MISGANPNRVMAIESGRLAQVEVGREAEVLVRSAAKASGTVEKLSALYSGRQVDVDLSGAW